MNNTPIPIEFRYYIDIILHILKIYQKPKTNDIINGQLKNILRQVLRSMDLILPLDVSVAAQEETDRLGKGSLYQYHWLTQHLLEGEPGRKTFLLEHFYPIGQQVSELLQKAEGKNDDQIDSLDEIIYREILSKSKLCWITKKEDELLTASGARSHRPNPEQTYRENGIVLLGEKKRDRRGNVPL